MQAGILDMLPRFAASSASPSSTEAAPRNPGTPRIEPVFGALLDELDYGVVLLLRDSASVVYVNRTGYRELRGGHCVEVVDGKLHARCPADLQPLGTALSLAQKGLRKLLTLGPAEKRTAVALIPIQTPLPGAPALIAVVFGRRHLCEQMSVQWFASVHGLTPAESKVLDLLCEGLDPRDIATANEVGMATVRTQVNAIREKTGAASIRALLQRLAMLPPMVNLLRY